MNSVKPNITKLLDSLNIESLPKKSKKKLSNEKIELLEGVEEHFSLLALKTSRLLFQVGTEKEINEVYETLGKVILDFYLELKTAIDEFVCIESLEESRLLVYNISDDYSYQLFDVWKRVISMSEIIIKASSKNVIKQIKDRFSKNEKDIIFDDILPLVNNIEFIDLIVEKKISFDSIINTRFCKSYSEALLYLSDKRKLNTGGNLLAGDIASKKADSFAEKMRSVFDKLDEQGFVSLKDKADELNSRNIKTPRGKKWTKAGVSRIINRLNKIDSVQLESITNMKPPKPE